jgi:7,8-dihydropterin-6-yl-methyl-4-(beta-D-ribofuranosyl)aminobenzene 5'-phosphate synthase
MLFDAGKSDLVVANIEACNWHDIPPAWIALSHGHYDHTTGVPALLMSLSRGPTAFHPQLLEQK